MGREGWLASRVEVAGAAAPDLAPGCGGRRIASLNWKEGAGLGVLRSKCCEGWIGEVSTWLEEVTGRALPLRKSRGVSVTWAGWRPCRRMSSRRR